MFRKRYSRYALATIISLSLTMVFGQGFLQNYSPVTDEVLNNPDAEDWLKWRRDNGASGHSPLDQITPENVGGLRLAWTWAMAPGSNEQEPLVYDGIMFLPHPGNIIQALDAETGALIWEYRRELPEGVGIRTNRNIALYEDKLYLTGRDVTIVALDARTGAIAWETDVAPYQDNIEYTAGPIVGGGMVFAGTTCGDPACFLSAYDAETGEELWRRESVAGPNDPQEANDTWGGVPFEGRTKASLWLAGSYDPDLNMLYWTTASAYPYPEMFKGTGDGDLLYTNSILAVNASTGEIEWYFQMQPRDNFDMDHMDNPILADIEINGEIRKVVYAAGKPGILWAFDRETGEHLWNRQLVAENNIYESIDPATGEIVMNEEIIPTEIGQIIRVCPGMRGGKLFQTKSYSPDSEIIVTAVSNACTNFEVIPPVVHDRGLNWDDHTYMDGTDGQVGRLAAVAADTGEVLWNYDQRAAIGSVLTTGGGLVFAGDFYRYFRAHDLETGEVLWEVPLSAPVTGYPISYGVGGTQYIAIAVGGDTAGTSALAALYPELRVSIGSNILMVFALDE